MRVETINDITNAYEMLTDISVVNAIKLSLSLGQVMAEVDYCVRVYYSTVEEDGTLRIEAKLSVIFDNTNSEDLTAFVLKRGMSFKEYLEKTCDA